jgi:EF-P beta-lysylation protein EpmB
MISRTATACQIPDWHREMAEAVTDPAELLRLLKLPESLLPAAQAAACRFALRVPRSFLRLIEPGNPADPLLLQVLPLARELEEHPGFVDDPLEESQAIQGPGLLSKYRGRSLLIASPACAVHCRYCFRREFPYPENRASQQRWRPTLDLLHGDPELEEVILSGGDPLSLDDNRLAELIRGLEDIPQLRRLRIHSRLPVVIPARITDGLLRLLADSRLKTVMVVHCNHPRELGSAFGSAMERLRPVAALLNQSVLLRGVNDDVQTLANLSRQLFDRDILPYYIHLMDQVRGAAHFQVGEHKAKRLLDALRAEMPGYLVPRLVRERAGEPAKTPLI